LPSDWVSKQGVSFGKLRYVSFCPPVCPPLPRCSLHRSSQIASHVFGVNAFPCVLVRKLTGGTVFEPDHSLVQLLLSVGLPFPRFFAVYLFPDVVFSCRYTLCPFFLSCAALAFSFFFPSFRGNFCRKSPMTSPGGSSGPLAEQNLAFFPDVVSLASTSRDEVPFTQTSLQAFFKRVPGMPLFETKMLPFFFFTSNLWGAFLHHLPRPFLAGGNFFNTAKGSSVFEISPFSRSLFLFILFFERSFALPPFQEAPSPLRVVPLRVAPHPDTVVVLSSLLPNLVSESLVSCV